MSYVKPYELRPLISAERALLAVRISKETGIDMLTCFDIVDMVVDAHKVPSKISPIRPGVEEGS